jgi:DNA polymerase-3 subunit chi
MGTAVFYHLTEKGLEETCAMILGRALGQGWRVMLRAPEVGVLEHLDRQLWLGPEESFLPHGIAGGPQDGLQPVLLGTGAIGNGAQGLMLVGGAGVEAGEVAGLERVWVLFDGNDEGAVQEARQMWLRLTGWGMGAQYWSDAGGAWSKKREKAAAKAEGASA